MTTATGTFTATGGGTALQLGLAGEVVSVAISGTYNQSIKLQRQVGSLPGAAWEDIPDIGPWTTANATVAESYTSKQHNERVRLLCYVDTSGTSTWSISDGDLTLDTHVDEEGNSIYVDSQAKRTYKKPVTFADNLVANEQTASGDENAAFGEWVDVVKMMLSPKTKHVVVDDFIGTWAISDAGPADRWQATVGSDTGTAAPVTATTVAAAPGGRVTMKSSNVETAGIAANGVAFNSIGLSYNPSQGELYAELYAELSDVSEAYLFFGFTDVLGGTTLEQPIFASGAATLDSDAANACGILLDKDSALTYFNAGGVKANADTTFPQAANHVIPADDTFFRLQVRVTTAGVLHAWVNGNRLTPKAGLSNAVTANTDLAPIVVLGTRSDNLVTLTMDYIIVGQDRPSITA